MAHLEWKDARGLVRWLRFDAVRVVDHQQTATVTKHPIEQGADIADHVSVDLPHISVTGYISIAPLSIDASIGTVKDIPIPSGVYQPVELPTPPVRNFAANALQQGLVGAAVSALSSATGPKAVESLITNRPEPGDRASIAAELLFLLQKDVERLRFVDELQTYEDMVLTSVIATRTQQVYGAVFQLELEQILITESALVDLPVPAEPRGQKAKSTANSPKNSNKPAVDQAKKSAALISAQKGYTAATQFFGGL